MSHVRVSVYIPSSLPTSASTIDSILAGMATLAGGATRQDVTGAWVMPDATLCTEPITIVSSISEGATFALLRSYAIGQAEALRVAMNQDAVLVTVDAVPEFILIDGSVAAVAA